MSRCGTGFVPPGGAWRCCRPLASDQRRSCSLTAAGLGAQLQLSSARSKCGLSAGKPSFGGERMSWGRPNLLGIRQGPGRGNGSDAFEPATCLSAGHYGCLRSPQRGAHARPVFRSFPINDSMEFYRFTCVMLFDVWCRHAASRGARVKSWLLQNRPRGYKPTQWSGGVRAAGRPIHCGTVSKSACSQADYVNSARASSARSASTQTRMAWEGAVSARAPEGCCAAVHGSSECRRSPTTLVDALRPGCYLGVHRCRPAGTNTALRGWASVLRAAPGGGPRAGSRGAGWRSVRLLCHF